MKTQVKKNNGISFKIITSFLIVISIIIFLIWLLEISLFKPVYKNIQSKEIMDVNNNIVLNYSSYQLDDYLKLSMENNCNILIFKEVDSNAQIIVNTSRTTNSFELNMLVGEFLKNIGNEEKVSYISMNKGEETINIGQVKNISGENIYFYTSSMLTPINGVVKVSTIVLLIISIISLLTTVIVSILLSRRISKPIQQLSKQAEQLYSGNLDIKFTGTGYDEVENLSNTLNYSISEIKKSETIQKEVIQNVSHELRTPLTLIESYTELIDDISGNDPIRRKKHTKIIFEEAKKLEQLINDMLDLSKMKANTLIYKIDKFNLSESIEKFETYYKNKYKEFDFTFTFLQSCFVLADKNRIEQVIANLINNAINYSQNENKKIIVTLAKFGDSYRFTVQDFGIGIPENDIPYVFDRHFRSTSAKRAVAGSGIGLSIVKEILNYHHFDFGLESKLNEGSMFFFEIPMEK